MYIFVHTHTCIFTNVTRCTHMPIRFHTRACTHAYTISHTCMHLQVRVPRKAGEDALGGSSTEKMAGESSPLARAGVSHRDVAARMATLQAPYLTQVLAEQGAGLSLSLSLSLYIYIYICIYISLFRTLNN